MDFKRITKFNALRAQMSETELAVADEFRDATDADRALIIESLAPQQAAKPARKQIERCTHVYASGLVCNGAARNIVHHNSAHLDFHLFTVGKQKKSRHAQSLAGAIQRAPKSKDAGDDDSGRCVISRADLDGQICGLLSDHNVHHMKSHAGYHPFVAASDAASVAGQLSANGAEQSATQNLEAQAASASVAAGGSDDQH